MGNAYTEGGLESLTPEASFRNTCSCLGTETVRATGGTDGDKWRDLGFKV